MPTLNDLNKLYERLIKDGYKNPFLNWIYDELDDFDKVCVFGMGSFSEISLPYLSKHLGNRLYCVSDNDPSKWNRTYAGVRCVPPDELLEHNDSIGIYVSVIDDDPVIDGLKNKGFKNVIGNANPLNARNAYKSASAYDLYVKNWHKIQELFSLLQDDFSRAVLLRYVRFSFFHRTFTEIHCLWPKYVPIISISQTISYS